MGLVVLLHGSALYAALHGTQRIRTEPSPLYVSFISATPAAEVSPVPSAPTPPPVNKAPAHLLTAASPSTAVVVSEPEPRPSTPASEATTPSEQAPSPPAPEPPAAMVPPDFVAAYLDNPAPVYPSLSRRLHESGEVLLRVHVETDGHGNLFEIDRSSGYDRLDQAALEAVRGWRFVPAHQGDVAKAAWVLIPINFRLDQ